MDYEYLNSNINGSDSRGKDLIKLITYCSQDIYLTGEPQISYWKSVYRCNTNVACEPQINNNQEDAVIKIQKAYRKYLTNK